MRLFILVLIGLLAACGTTQATIPYGPTIPVQAVGGRVAVAISEPAVNERRGRRHDPHWIGTGRTGVGSPLTGLRADRPVDEVVARLRRRLGGVRPGRVAGRRFPTPPTCSPPPFTNPTRTDARREAAAGFGVVLTECATGRAVWRDRHRAYRVDGPAATVDAFALASVWIPAERRSPP